MKPGPTVRLLTVLTLAIQPCLVLPAPARLHITVEDAADPFSREDGSGYANDIVRAAFAAVGVHIVFDVVPYVRCKNDVLSGRSASCMSMSWDPAFEGHIKFADLPLFTVTPIYFENSAHPLKARTEAQLGAGVTVGTVRGYEYPDAAMRVRERGAIFDAARSEQINLKKLAAGRLDAALLMSNPITGVAHWIEQAQVGTEVRAAFPSAQSSASYLAFSIHHPDGMANLAKYNAGFKIISTNGAIDKIKSKWATKAR